MPDGESLPRESGCSTIEITFGTSERTSRVELKKRMAAFGEVDVCHMGTRGQDFPFVRFRTQAAAEVALKALKSGEVFLEDGAMLAGEWKTGTRRRESAPPVPEHRRRDETEDMTSRNLIYSSRGSRGSSGRSPSYGRGNSGGRRNRSRSRRRRSHSQGRSRRQSSRSRQHRGRKRSHSRHGTRRGSRSRGANSRSGGDGAERALTNGGPPVAGGAASVSAPHSAELEGDDAVGYSNPLFNRKRRAP